MNTKLIKKTTLTGGILLLFMLISGQPALEAKSDGQPLGGHLTITEVQVDCEDGTITIFGVDFDFGPGPLEVTLGDFIGPLSIVGTPTANEIIVNAPYNLCDQPRDYLLTVSTGKGQSQGDEYDLTIGAVGPQGERGPQGPVGPPGEQTGTGMYYMAYTHIEALHIPYLTTYKDVSLECPHDAILYDYEVWCTNPSECVSPNDNEQDFCATPILDRFCSCNVTTYDVERITKCQDPSICSSQLNYGNWIDTGFFVSGIKISARVGGHACIFGAYINARLYCMKQAASPPPWPE